MSKINKVKITVGLITIAWGLALLVYGPFYSRGFLVNRNIGAIICFSGAYYIAIEIVSYRKRKVNSRHNKEDID